MKSIRDKIVYCNYEGHINSRNDTLLFQEISSIKDEIKIRNLKGIFISLKDTNYTQESLEQFLKKLIKIDEKLPIHVSIGEYTSKTYNMLQERLKNSSIKLFKTEKIGKLFLTPDSFNKKMKVLILDDGDEEDLDKQSSILSQHEHAIHYTKDIDNFTKILKEQSVDCAVSQSKINLKKEPLEEKKPKFSISKNLIINLPIFIDTAVDNLETLTALNAKKINHEIKPFSPNIEGAVVNSIMTFKGDISGAFTLVFPKDLAKLSIEAMLGEKLDENNIEAISDGIGEFCNIITGGAKTTLSKKNVKVLFDLPKTYTSLSSTKKALPQSDGVCVKMELANKEFYMFLTS